MFQANLSPPIYGMSGNPQAVKGALASLLLCALFCPHSTKAQTASPASPSSAAATTLAPNSLKLGLIGPLTGGSADFGQTMVNGVKLAITEINAVGGFLGRKIELVVKDDKGDNAAGKAASDEMVKEGVVAALGFCNTGVALASIDVFQNAKVPLIVPCATGTPVTAKFPTKDSYIFRNSARDLVQAPFVVDDILKRGLNRVAIFADTTGYGEAGMNDVIKALAAKGLKPVHVARFPLGVKDLTAELSAAREAGANVLFAYTVGPENAVLAKSRAELGWRVPHMGAWTLSFPNFIKAAGKDAEGALMSQTFIAEPSNERRSSFLSAYAKTYGASRIPVPMAAAQAYDATYLMMYAFFGIRDGKVTGPAIKAALENLQRPYYGVVTTYEQPFSAENKDAMTRNTLVMGVVKGGAVTFAYAEDAKKNFIIQRK